jgi:hypothetical protein
MASLDTHNRGAHLNVRAALGASLIACRMRRLHPTRGALHTEVHRARTCKHVKYARLARLCLLLKHGGLRKARLQRICTHRAPDARVLCELHALVPQCGLAQREAVAVVEVRGAKRSPEVNIEDGVAMQDIALRE